MYSSRWIHFYMDINNDRSYADMIAKCCKVSAHCEIDERCREVWWKNPSNLIERSDLTPWNKSKTWSRSSCEVKKKEASYDVHENACQKEAEKEMTWGESSGECYGTIGAQDCRINQRTDCSSHEQLAREKIRTECWVSNQEKQRWPYLLDWLKSETFA